VLRAPELLYHHYEGDPVCSFVLTHTIDHEPSGHWELQHYHVSIQGELGEAFAAGYQPGQKVIITGRLDSPAVDTDGLVPGRAWIIATHITILGPDGQDR
jgi:single-stranded DNA-binding protein